MKHVDRQQGEQAADVLPADEHQHGEGAEQPVDGRRGAGDRRAGVTEQLDRGRAAEADSR